MLNSWLSYIYKRDDSVLNCLIPSSSVGHLTKFIFHLGLFVKNVMWVLPVWNYTATESRVYESTKCSGQRTTFLLLWPTALRILPFKVRPHSVSPYPHARLIPLSPGGSLGAPESPFISCHQPVMRSHLQEISEAGSFPRTVKRNSSWWPFILRFVWRGSYTSGLHSWVIARQ